MKWVGSGQERYAKKHREQGLCVKCPRPATGRFCPRHRKQNRENVRAHRSRERTLKELGK